MLNTHYDSDDISDIIREERESEIKDDLKRICPDECRDCDELRPYFDDCTIYDLGGPKDIRLKAVCFDFPDGCEPERCLKVQTKKLIDDIDRMATQQTNIRELGNLEIIRSRLAEIFNLKKSA